MVARKLWTDFGAAISKDFDLVDSSHSTQGVGLVSDGIAIAAICGICRHMLGWTFTNGSGSVGYWSCLEGCHTRYPNHLEATTSSYTQLKDSSRVLTKWLSGWLGVDWEKIEVKFNDAD